MAAKLTGPKHLIVIDMVQSKLDLAKKYGATHTINGSSEDVQESIRRITDGRGVDFALDCAGSPAILRAGQASLVARGTLITVGGLEGKDIVLEGNTVIPKGMCYRACHQGDSVPQLVRVSFLFPPPLSEALALAHDSPLAATDLWHTNPVQATLNNES